MFFDLLSAPFWSMLGPFGSIWALLGTMLDPFGSILETFRLHLAEFCKVGVSQRMWSQNEDKIKPTHHKETNP